MKNEELPSTLFKNYGLHPVWVRKIKQGMINDNYLFKDSSGRKFIFKIYDLKKARLKSAKDIEFSLLVLQHLEKYNFPCPRLIPVKSGAFCSVIYGRPGVLLKYIEGHALAEGTITPALMREIGILEGRLHGLLRNFKAPKARRDTWEPEDLRRYLRKESPNIKKKFSATGERIISFISEEFHTLSLPCDLPAGITHQDIKPENIIVDKNRKVSFVDFDNAYYGTFLYDLMTTAIWSCFRSGQPDKRLFRAFLAGYESERPLTLRERECLTEALRFRLLREAFAWPMRFSTPQAIVTSERFLAAYRAFLVSRPDLF